MWQAGGLPQWAAPAGEMWESGGCVQRMHLTTSHHAACALQALCLGCREATAGEPPSAGGCQQRVGRRRPLCTFCDRALFHFCGLTHEASVPLLLIKERELSHSIELRRWSCSGWCCSERRSRRRS